MDKLLVICGPTATGKTALATALCSSLNGEIVSADSRQVYIGMDIGTGKDLPKSSKLPWLLDVVRPDQKFSVADYVRLATGVIKDITRRKKLPIMVGGTGFYIKGVIDGIETLGISPDWGLRKRLGDKDIWALNKELQKLDIERWDKMNESDRKNPRRLIRAIEVATKLKSQKSNPKIQKKTRIDSLLVVGLTAPLKTLYKMIDRRVDERVKMGQEEEIRKLLEMGYTWQNSVLGTTLGYREWQSFFEGKVAKEEVIQRWKFAEHNYARRQMTWFKRDRRIHWFDITKQRWQNELSQLVLSWYNR